MLGKLLFFTLLWMLLSGRLLPSRGAVIPSLADLGLSEDAVRRPWIAQAYGRRSAGILVADDLRSTSARPRHRPS